MPDLKRRMVNDPSRRGRRFSGCFAACVTLNFLRAVTNGVTKDVPQTPSSGLLLFQGAEK